TVAAEDYLIKAQRIARNGEPTASFHLAEIHYRKGNLEEARRQVGDALRLLQQPGAEVLWLALRIERKLGNRGQEAEMAARLRKEYPNSREYQDFLKGNFE
ncbi:MAG: type pilus biosis/stability protein PilW, partial [Pseudomonadota bacterium]